jgi:hypothetical protein
MEIVGKFIKRVTYADTTRVLAGTLPPNSMFTRITACKVEAFNAGGNDYIDIGDSTTAAKFVDNLDVSSQGVADATLVAAATGIVSATNSTDIYVVYVPSASAPTTGIVDLVFEYAQK